MTIGELVDVWEKHEDEVITLYLSSFYGMDMQRYQDQDEYRDLKVDKFTVNGGYELVIYAKLPTPQKLKLLYDPYYDPDTKTLFGSIFLPMFDIVAHRQYVNAKRIEQKVRKINDSR